MEIGIGLNATIPGTDRDQLLEWARRADAAGFASLGVIDRTVFPNLESLVALTAAAAVTERIRLTTAILIAPLRSNTALLAKQIASLDVISAGRAVLGLAVGGREDDFEAGGVDARHRGRIFDAQLDEMKRIWAGEERGMHGGVGPTPVQAGGPTILIGGTAGAAVRRTVQHGAGWISGGGGPQAFIPTAEKVRQAWAEAGRAGSPRLAALAYFALGPDATEQADSYLRDYYGFVGPYIDRVVKGALTDDDKIRAVVGEFEAAGCDELILFPCNPDPDQVGLLATSVGLAG